MTGPMVEAMRSVGIPEDKIAAVLHMVPWIEPRDFEEIKRAIYADPCRNWRVVARRYRVSRATVYRAWGGAA